MIVESKYPREIGEIFDLPEFEVGHSRTVRVQIMREATEEEYIADCLADPTLPEESRNLMVVTGRKDLHWYEVHTD